MRRFMVLGMAAIAGVVGAGMATVSQSRWDSLSSVQAQPVPGSTGLVVKASGYSVEETRDRFTNILENKGLTIFGVIDHAENAANAELSLRPTTLVMFGNAKLGTPLMQCEQALAIELPQKVLIWEDEQGQVQLAYNDPRYLSGRHRLGDCGSAVIEKIGGALNGLTDAAVK